MHDIFQFEYLKLKLYFLAKVSLIPVYLNAYVDTAMLNEDRLNFDGTHEVLCRFNKFYSVLS